jgi:polyhydroxyalkanoate synthesis regulator phasin
MTAEELASVTLEHLRAIRAKQDEQGDELAAIRLELSAMGQQIGALTTAVYSGKSELDSLKRRVERIERRLELSEPPN